MRSKIEKYIIKSIDTLDPTGKNTKIYKDLFKSMNQKEFDEWVSLIGTEFHISLVVPIGLDDMRLDMNHLKDIAHSRGIKLFERVYMEESGMRVLSPNKFNIIRTTIRRSNQHATSKIILPKDNKTRNALTGQVTGKSKGVSISQPESLILTGYALPNLLNELMSVRGGDVNAVQLFESLLIKNGEASLADLKGVANKTQAIISLKNYFKAIHIDLQSKPKG